MSSSLSRSSDFEDDSSGLFFEGVLEERSSLAGLDDLAPLVDGCLLFASVFLSGDESDEEEDDDERDDADFLPSFFLPLSDWLSLFSFVLEDTSFSGELADSCCSLGFL